MDATISERKKQTDNSSGKKKTKNANNGIRVSHGVKYDIRPKEEKTGGKGKM